MDDSALFGVAILPAADGLEAEANDEAVGEVVEEAEAESIRTLSKVVFKFKESCLRRKRRMRERLSMMLETNRLHGKGRTTPPPSHTDIQIPIPARARTHTRTHAHTHTHTHTHMHTHPNTHAIYK